MPCHLCGCDEEEHGADDGTCTGCGELCDYEPEDDDDAEYEAMQQLRDEF